MNSPYILIPLVALVTFLYLVSYLLVRYRIISKKLQRKFWNSILLITFLVTALLGLLLVVQINYKLEWSFVKTMLRYHVDFGIAMCFTAVFHLIWHWKYYTSIFSSGAKLPKEVSTQTNLTGYPVLALLTLLSGFVSTVVQILLLREIITVFQGNELMMGWTIGIWMLLTGTGAYLGKRKTENTHSPTRITNIILIISLLAVAIQILLNLLKNQLFLPGVRINPVYFVITMLVIFSPVCLLSGFTFSLLVGSSQVKNGGFIRVYALEALGSLTGGIIVSFVFIQWFSILQSLLFLLLLIITLYSVIRKTKTFILFPLLTLIALIMTFVFPVDNFEKSFLYVHQHVLKTTETLYGNITITETAGQYSVFDNGSLLFTTDNVVNSEEHVHYAMLQSDNPANILLISGGMAGMLDEILKYSTVNRIDYVEINPFLVRLVSEFRPHATDPRINIVNEDGRRFVRHTKEKYDVAIVALPDPSSLELNRLYTKEFLELLKAKLNHGAVVLFSHSPAGNYVSREKEVMEASVYNTLRSNFDHVTIIPGERDYFVASDSPVTNEVSSLASVKGIETNYVNADYLDDFIIKQRADALSERINNLQTVTTDQRPLPVFFHSLQFISQFYRANAIWYAIPMILLLFFLVKLKPFKAGIFSAGFSVASFEILLIFAFQTYFGYVYSAIGLITAVVMAGLALGSIIAFRFSIVRKHFISGQLLLTISVIAFPLVWLAEQKIQNEFLGTGIILLIAFVLSGIVGFLYVAGTRLSPGNNPGNASVLYAFDLIGSSVGVVVSTLLLIPLLGVYYTCIFIAGINMLAMAKFFFRRNYS